MNKQAEGLSGEQLGRLRRVLHSPILTPSDAEYERARHVWNGMIDRKPLVIVRPTSISDVIQSVRFARDHGIAASVRGGGHSAAGKAVADGARSKPSHSLSNTLQVLTGTCRQTIRPLPTEPLEILRYALSEVEKTVCPDNEVPSIVWIRDILNEGIIVLEAQVASVSLGEL